jgi:hypothetical protein
MAQENRPPDETVAFGHEPVGHTSSDESPGLAPRQATATAAEGAVLPPLAELEIDPTPLAQRFESAGE